MTKRIVYIASLLIAAFSTGAATAAEPAEQNSSERRFLRRLELQDIPCSTELRPVLCGADGAFHYNLCQAIKSGYSEEDCHEENGARSSSSVRDLSSADAERLLECGNRNRPVRCEDIEFLNMCQARTIAGYKRSQCVRIPPFPDRRLQ